MEQTFYRSHLVWSRSDHNHTLFQRSPFLAAVWKQASIEWSVCMRRHWYLLTHTHTHAHSCYTQLNWPQMEEFCCGRLPSVRCPPSCRLSAIWTIKKGEVKLNKWRSQWEWNSLTVLSDPAVLETFPEENPSKQSTRPHHLNKRGIDIVICL